MKKNKGYLESDGPYIIHKFYTKNLISCKQRKNYKENFVLYICMYKTWSLLFILPIIVHIMDETVHSSTLVLFSYVKDSV